jgi:hypothetical protein
MVEAYAGEGRTSYKYQYSALPATHGADLRAYFGPLGGVPSLSEYYQRAFMSKWWSAHTVTCVLTQARNLGQLRHAAKPVDLE